MLRQSFNEGWSFYKAGREGRRTVMLPHDAMLEEARTPDAPSGSAGAFFHGDVYTYEKEFEAPEDGIYYLYFNECQFRLPDCCE